MINSWSQQVCHYSTQHLPQFPGDNRMFWFSIDMSESQNPIATGIGGLWLQRSPVSSSGSGLYRESRFICIGRWPTLWNVNDHNPTITRPKMALVSLSESWWTYHQMDVELKNNPVPLSHRWGRIYSAIYFAISQAEHSSTLDFIFRIGEPNSFHEHTDLVRSRELRCPVT